MPVADRGPPRATNRKPLREAGTTRRRCHRPPRGHRYHRAGHLRPASRRLRVKWSHPPASAPEPTHRPGAHTNRATSTGHHGRPGHQAAITIHQAQLKPISITRSPSIGRISYAVRSSGCDGLSRIGSQGRPSQVSGGFWPNGSRPASGTASSGFRARHPHLTPGPSPTSSTVCLPPTQVDRGHQVPDDHEFPARHLQSG